MVPISSISVLLSIVSSDETAVTSIFDISESVSLIVNGIHSVEVPCTIVSLSNTDITGASFITSIIRDVALLSMLLSIADEAIIFEYVVIFPPPSSIVPSKIRSILSPDAIYGIFQVPP